MLTLINQICYIRFLCMMSTLLTLFAYTQTYQTILITNHSTSQIAAIFFLNVHEDLDKIGRKLFLLYILDQYKIPKLGFQND